MFALTMACHALQVYGGAIGVVVGPYAWSLIATGPSSASCANTSCTNCSVHIIGTSITDSRAISNTSGNFAAIFVLICVHKCRQFLSKMISDVVDRQLVRGVCKSDRRRVQMPRNSHLGNRCTAVAWRSSFSLTFGARVHMIQLCMILKQETRLFQDFWQFSSIVVSLVVQL